MQNDKNSLLKGILLFVGIYHITIGLLGFFMKDLAIYLARTFFNFNLTLTPQVYWIINPFAAYVFIFGIFMAVAATNPVKYKAVVNIGVALFAIRIAQRAIFFFTAPENLIAVTDPIRNLIALGIITIIGILMFVLSRKLE